MLKRQMICYSSQYQEVNCYSGYVFGWPSKACTLICKYRNVIFYQRLLKSYSIMLSDNWNVLSCGNWDAIQALHIELIEKQPFVCSEIFKARKIQSLCTGL